MRKIVARGKLLLVLLPFLVLYCNRSVGMWWDVMEFHDWFKQSLQARPDDARTGFFSNVYRASACNYPALGAILSAGAMGWTSDPSGEKAAGALGNFRSFRLYLACFEALSVLLLFLLLTLLSGGNAWVAAVAFYLLPSSWAGGATWGQIDIINQCCLLFAAHCSVRLILKTPESSHGCLRLAALGLSGIVSSILIKQISLFSLPGLSALWLVGLVAVLHRHGSRVAVKAALGSLALGLLYFLALDRALFLLPDGYSGTLEHALTTGSGHTGKLSGNGPNLWTFLHRDNSSSSAIPFHASITPVAAGFAMYFLFFAALSLLVFLHVGRLCLDRRRFADHPAMICCVLFCYIGMSNLMMGIFITGTHERHLFHAFPFLLIAAYVSSKRGFLAFMGRNLWSVCIVSFVYGCFVYSIIDENAFTFSFVLRSQAFVAASVIILFGVLYWGFFVHILRSWRFGID